MLNSVTLTGRLTRDVDLRHTQNNTAVGTFTLAVDRQFSNANGEREADFINCVIWRKGAENLAKFVRKGSRLGVQGRLQTRNYENNQGERVYITEVVVENFALPDSRRNDSKTTVAQVTNQSQSSNMPQTNPAVEASDPFTNAGKPVDIADDDLPF